MKEIKGNTGKKTNRKNVEFSTTRKMYERNQRKYRQKTYRKNVEFSFWSYMEFIYRLKFLFH